MLHFYREIVGPKWQQKPVRVEDHLSIEIHQKINSYVIGIDQRDLWFDPELLKKHQTVAESTAFLGYREGPKMPLSKVSLNLVVGRLGNKRVDCPAVAGDHHVRLSERALELFADTKIERVILIKLGNHIVAFSHHVI